jgi:hypothetical protein
LLICPATQVNTYSKSAPKYFWRVYGSVDFVTRWPYCPKPTKTKYSTERGINRSCCWQRSGRQISSHCYPGEIDHDLCVTIRDMNIYNIRCICCFPSIILSSYRPSSRVENIVATLIASHRAMRLDPVEYNLVLTLVLCRPGKSLYTYYVHVTVQYPTIHSVYTLGFSWDFFFHRDNYLKLFTNIKNLVEPGNIHT